MKEDQKLPEPNPPELPKAAALTESETLYRTLAELVPVQVWTARRDGQLDYVSEQTAAYFGVPSRQLLGDGWGRFVHPDDLTEVDARWTHARRTGESYEVEFRLLAAADDQYRWHLGRAVPRRDADGEIVGWVGTNTDIEAGKVLRAAAEEAQRQAEVANQAKSDFLATMSHEIRTPINAVLGYADLMNLGIGGPLTDQQRDYLARLTSSGRHLLGLVNEVLDLARIESGRLSVMDERIELPTVIEAALALVGPQAAARGLSLEYISHITDSAVVLGDEARVRQILVNLLANAVKFTHPVDHANTVKDAWNGGVASITVTCGTAAEPDRHALLSTTTDRAGPWRYVRVADTGIGIPAEHLEAVFEPFVQIESVLTRTRGGTGLGLAISRRLARLMGGDLTVESRVGRGSTFTFWLPAPMGAERAVAHKLSPATLDPPIREGLYTLGEWLSEEAEHVTRTFAQRLRADPAVPLAQGLAEVDLVDHISTFLIDIAGMLQTVADSEDLTTAMQDGTDIQQLISERHGAQRFRLGFSEAMLDREFVLFEEHIAGSIRAGMPGAPGRGVEVLTLFIRLAKRISVGGFRHAQEAERARVTVVHPVQPE